MLADCEASLIALSEILFEAEYIPGRQGSIDMSGISRRGCREQHGHPACARA
jgi:hypothetical protein